MLQRQSFLLSLGLWSMTSFHAIALDSPIDMNEDVNPVQPASTLQQTPLLKPSKNLTDPGTASSSYTRLSRLPQVRPSTSLSPRSGSTFATKDVILGDEAFSLSTTDLGNLVKKSPAGLSTNVQNRGPGVSDGRTRGQIIGAGNTSGSHWVPARIDLDTALSKFDSRQVEKLTIIPGPFSSLYGPGFSFSELKLLGSPRFREGAQQHGSTDLEYKINGNQTFGQQTVLAGAENWGARINYAARESDDYFGGGRTRIASGYESKELLMALGRDWKNNTLEFSLLRQDQSDVVLPGYVFDLDSLVTDGYEIKHTGREAAGWDSVITDVWYNRTQLSGNAQNPRKRIYFPGLTEQEYVGFTDVDSMSTGYRQQFVLGQVDEDSYELTVGHDLRWVSQELNEISNGKTLGSPFRYTNRNSPIPRSYAANPGLFAEYQEDIGESVNAKIGGRLDYSRHDLAEDPSNLGEIGADSVPVSYSQIVGTSDFQRDFSLASAFLSVRHDRNDWLTTTTSLGYAERAPTLTELYAAQPFMNVLQNGLNNVTGDPSLSKERLIQLDVGGEYNDDKLKSGIRVFSLLGLDYITFESTGVTNFAQNTKQVNLRFKNTDYVTIGGVEWFGELAPKSPITPFANLRFLEGRNHTRSAARLVEPLPGISPLESRVGIRAHDVSSSQRWTIDLSARLVASQNQVAASLKESQTAGFTTWDLRSVYRFAGNPKIYIATGIENMFDRLYREHFDFRDGNNFAIYQPGANFYVSTSVEY